MVKWDIMEFELWVKIIKESIDKKNIEPWNINIADIADEYIKTIRELRKFDIRLSADVILVGGILLRMKSQILYGECENTFNDEEEMDDDELEYYEDELNYADIEDEKKENNKIEKKKKDKNKIKQKNITFNDLISTLKSELDKVKKTKPKRRSKKETPIYDIIEEMEEEYDISDLMECLLSELRREGRFIFQNKFSSKKDIVKNFLPSLYLANDGRIEIYQEEIFKDIVLKYKN
jgi:segregation and condensation protein A